jgi:hypothetical protein
LQYNFQKETTPARIAFYQLGADFYNEQFFAGAAYGGAEFNSTRYIRASDVDDDVYTGSDSDGQGTANEAGWGYIPNYYRVPCLSETNASGPCWFFLPAKGQKTDGSFADRAIIVRRWDAVLGGQRVTAPHFSLYRQSGERQHLAAFDSTGVKVGLELSPPPGVHTLLPGDYIDADVELLVLPRSASDYNAADGNADFALELQAEDDLAASLGATDDGWTPAPDVGAEASIVSIAPADVVLEMRANPVCQSYGGWMCGRWYIQVMPTGTAPAGATGPLTFSGNGETMELSGIGHWAWAGSGFYVFPTATQADYSNSILEEFKEKFPVGTVLTVGHSCEGDCGDVSPPNPESTRLRSHWHTTWRDASRNSGPVNVFQGAIQTEHPLRVQVDTDTQAAYFRVSSGVGHVPIIVSEVSTPNCTSDLVLLHSIHDGDNTVPHNWVAIEDWQSDFDAHLRAFTFTYNVLVDASTEAATNHFFWFGLQSDAPENIPQPHEYASTATSWMHPPAPPNTVSETSTPTPAGAQEVRFELLVADQTAVEVQNNLATYTQALADSLGVDFSRVTITVVPRRRLIESTGGVTLLVTVTASASDTTTATVVEAEVTTSTFAATIVTQLQTAGVTATLTVDTATVSTISVSDPLALDGTSKPIREGIGSQFNQGFTSYCSHIHCELDPTEKVRVHYHHAERYGHKNICRHEMHVANKCGCECFDESTGMADFLNQFTPDLRDTMEANTVVDPEDDGAVIWGPNTGN